VALLSSWPWLVFISAVNSFGVVENGFQSWQQLQMSQGLDYSLTAILEAENRIACNHPPGDIRRLFPS